MYYLFVSLFIFVLALTLYLRHAITIEQLAVQELQAASEIAEALEKVDQAEIGRRELCDSFEEKLGLIQFDFEQQKRFVHNYVSVYNAVFLIQLTIILFKCCVYFQNFFKQTVSIYYIFSSRSTFMTLRMDRDRLLREADQTKIQLQKTINIATEQGVVNVREQAALKEEVM